MDYPYQLLFPGGKEVPGVVRLKVAVIAALLDFGSFEGTVFSEADFQPYEGDDEFTASDGKSYQVYSRPQTFFSIQPSGYLAVATKKTLQAIEKSILANQLQTVVVRFNLNGEVDPVNTWVHLDSISDWMESRGINTGDLFGQLWDDEEEVFLAAAKAGDALRLKLETPDVEPELKMIREYANWDDSTNEKFLELLRRNAALRAGGQQATSSDRPLTGRERDTLLTIIAVLCKEAKIPYEKPAKAAGMIQSTAAHMGVAISETAIENHLKKARNAVAARMK